MQTINSTRLKVSIILTLAILVTEAQTNGQVPKIAEHASSRNAEEVLAGFEKRVDQMFRSKAGEPLVRARKNKPLGPGRGNYVRHYSWSMVEFAARCFYLDEMLGEANAALVENAQHYLDNPKDINDRDSFHWHAEMVLRLVELYGTNGSRNAGRMTAETETLVLKPIWEYARTFSTLARAEVAESQTWHVWESENHHVMGFTVCWHFAKLAKDREEFKHLKYADGTLAAEHYSAWNRYFVVYCRERARKGMFIEMMNESYNSVLLKGIYNFYDFGEPRVRRAAGQLLDLYYAYWAQEQIDTVQGGGRSRIYFHKGLKHNPTGEGAQLSWFYFGMGEPARILCPSLNAALSGYRPPAVVADIALDVAGRGRYEVRQRPLGLATSGGMHPYKLRTDFGGIQRYSYCDPAFIIGTPMTEARPLEDWTGISAQNRWQGVIFSGDKEARIVPIVRPKDNRVAMNGQWSVQCKGSLITQKLKTKKGGAEMLVWISKQGLGDPIEEDGLVFVEAEGAYAAIRVIKGGFEWARSKGSSLPDPFAARWATTDGATMILKQEYAPVILEVMAKTDVKSFELFRKKVKSADFEFVGDKLVYNTIYGDQLTFHTDYKQVPSINGKPVDYARAKAFESPFLDSDWNSGIVTIRKGDRKKVLDFNGTSRVTPR